MARRNPISIAGLLAVLCATGAVAAAARTPRRVCRRACRVLVRSRCAQLFGVNGRCRAALLRQCRFEGTAQCDEARACSEDCDSIEMQCVNAAKPTDESGAEFGPVVAALCQGFVLGRCVEHGRAYCSALPTRNGCNAVAAEDHRGEPLVTVTFGVDEFAYDYAPECIRVSPGTTVRFQGSFADEPLVGGDAPIVDPMSPFAPETTSGTTRDFVLTQPGIFPYFGGDFAQYPVVNLLGNGGLPWGAVIVDGSD